MARSGSELSEHRDPAPQPTSRETQSRRTEVDHEHPPVADEHAGRLPQDPDSLVPRDGMKHQRHQHRSADASSTGN